MRLVEAIGAAVVVAVLVIVITWGKGVDLVAVPSSLALLTFVAVMLRPGGRSPRRPATRRRARANTKGVSR